VVVEKGNLLRMFIRGTCTSPCLLLLFYSHAMLFKVAFDYYFGLEFRIRKKIKSKIVEIKEKKMKRKEIKLYLVVIYKIIIVYI
jgi:hypothetical protein